MTRKIERVHKSLENAENIKDSDVDSESVQRANAELKEAKKILGTLREEYRTEIRQVEQDWVYNRFENVVRKNAEPDEIAELENLLQASQRDN